MIGVIKRLTFTLSTIAIRTLYRPISVAQCRFWQRVGCSILLRGVSSWSLGYV